MTLTELVVGSTKWFYDDGKWFYVSGGIAGVYES